MKYPSLSLRTCLLAVITVLMTGATDAFANDPVAADALFQAGKQLIAEKKYTEACAKFDASYQLDPTLGTLLNLADCYEKAGRFATSWSTWGQAMEQATRDNDPRVDYAKERREALAPKLPKVVIHVSGMMPGIDVLWDGTKLAPGAFGTDIPTDVLAHKLVVRRDDGVVLGEQSVFAREDGKKAEITLDIAALDRAHPRASPDKPPAPVPQPAAPSTSQSTAGLVIGGVGLAAILTAGGLELNALLKRNEANESSACIDNFCTPSGIEAIDAAQTYAEAGQWVGLFGIVVFSVGTTLFLAAPSAPAPPVTSTSQASNVRGATDRHPRLVSPSSIRLSPWAGPTGGGIVVGGAL